MTTRTSYFALEFQRGELKQVEEQGGAKLGVDLVDLTNAEANAMRRVNQYIIKCAGATVGAAIVAIFMDDANAIDPLVAHLAELIAAGDILEQWERFNYADETREGATQRRDADNVRGRATQIAQDIMDSGGTLTATGTFRRWFYASNQQGPRVTGPMSKGSYFDLTGYTDPWGRRYPGPVDPRAL